MPLPAPTAPAAGLTFTPRSILDRAYWLSLAADPTRAACLDRVEKLCAETPAKPPVAAATTYLAARRDNNREARDRFWHVERGRLAALAVRRALGGVAPQDRDDRLLDWLWAFLTEPTWAVSAHLPGNDLPALGRPALDLPACEMAAFLAELREVLKPWLDSVSDTLADSIIVAVDAQILTPYGDGAEVWWQNAAVPRYNNWLGVCAGSILAACESLGVQGHPRPKARARALEGLRTFLRESFTPHGECDEGLGYWCYGMGFACLGWSRLSRGELSSAVDLERLRQVADYPRRAHLFADCFFSGNDGSLHCAAPLDFVPWLAAVTGNGFLAAWAERHPALNLRHLGQVLRVLAAPEFVPPGAGRPAGASGLETSPAAPRFLEDQQVAILRQPAPAGELVVCLTGGHNDERHNHSDLGHFLAAVHGQVIIPDLGAPHYQADFFGPQRYTYVSASSRGHCCPLIGEFEQRAGPAAAARVVSWEPAAERPKLTLDLTAAYPPAAGLLAWTRSLEQRPAGKDWPPRMVVSDFFQTRESGQHITHVLWSLVPFREPDERVAGTGVRLALGPLSVELSPAPTALGRAEFSPAALLLRDYAGQTLYRIEAVYRTDERGELRIETRLYVT